MSLSTVKCESIQYDTSEGITSIVTDVRKLVYWSLYRLYIVQLNLTNTFYTILIPFFSGIWFATDCRCYLQYKVATWQVSLLAALSLDGHRINLEGVQLC